MSNQETDSANNKPIIIDPRILNNYYSQDDEINLVDLWLSLVKHKESFFITFLLIIGFGVIYTILQPVIYNYSTTIDIGTKADKETLIQPVGTVKSEVNSAYINQALHDYYNDNDIITISVDNPNDTSLIILKSHGTSEESEIHLTIHQNILDRLTAKHNVTSKAIIEEFNTKKLSNIYALADLENDDFFATQKLEAENILNKSREQLTKLQEQNINNYNALTRLTTLHDLLQSQYKNDINNLKTVIKNQQRASKNSSDTPLLILLTSELQQYRTHIASLDERINIKVPAQEEKIKQQIADNKRAQEIQKVFVQQAGLALTKLQVKRERQIASLKTELSKIENNIASLPITHAIVPPSRSFEPVNSKNKLITAVSIVLGLFIGLFVALFSRFLTKVKEQE